MEPNHFDQLTRSILAPWSRRGVCRALAGLTLSAAALLLRMLERTGAR